MKLILTYYILLLSLSSLTLVVGYGLFTLLLRTTFGRRLERLLYKALGVNNTKESVN